MKMGTFLVDQLDIFRYSFSLLWMPGTAITAASKKCKYGTKLHDGWSLADCQSSANGSRREDGCSRADGMSDADGWSHVGGWNRVDGRSHAGGWSMWMAGVMRVVGACGWCHGLKIYKSWVNLLVVFEIRINSFLGQEDPGTN